MKPFPIRGLALCAGALLAAYLAVTAFTLHALAGRAEPMVSELSARLLGAEALEACPEGQPASMHATEDAWRHRRLLVDAEVERVRRDRAEARERAVLASVLAVLLIIIAATSPRARQP